MGWILIYIFASWDGRSVEVTGIEFNTLEACQFAIVEMRKRIKNGDMVCVPKGLSAVHKNILKEK